MTTTDKLPSRKRPEWTLTLYQDGEVISLGAVEVTLSSISPALADLSPAQLRALEWSDRRACVGTSGAWLACPCCGAVKIDLKGHAPGCTMAAAIVASCGRDDAAVEAGEGAAPWVVHFPDGGTEMFLGLGARDTGEFGARLRQRQWRATVGRDVETGTLS